MAGTDNSKPKAQDLAAKRPATPPGAIALFFDFARYGATMRGELIGGITTFIAMSYIVAVNPAILSAAGIPAGASMVTTVIAAAAGSLLMGLYANRPFAVAPYMGENAFIAFTVVRTLGYTWQSAMAAVFISGVLFVLLTAARIRPWLVEAVPAALRHGFGVGIGLFLSFVGLNEAGIVTLGVAGAPVRIGALNSPQVLIAIAGFLLIALLLMYRVNGAPLLGIMLTALACFALGIAPAPRVYAGLPPDPRPLLMQIDLHGVLGWGFFGILITVFVMAFCDTLGTLIAVAARADLLDPDGHLPRIEQPMMVDALATTLAGLIGASTTGAYMESAAGVMAGARTGLSSVVTATLFLASLLFAPFIAAIPPAAYSPVLIIVGLQMAGSIVHIDFADLTEAVPALCVVLLMSFTYNIAIGVTAGFVLYPLFKVATGKWREVRAGLWFLAALSLMFYVFYPYR
jgi:AGZA family xanthine/uracil permease-like MFS transporter